MRYSLEPNQSGDIAVNRCQKHSQAQYRLCAGVHYPNLVVVRPCSMNELPPPYRQIVASDAQTRQITLPHMCDIIFIEDCGPRPPSCWPTTSFRITERHAK
jgi:hypothetical protein